MISNATNVTNTKTQTYLFWDFVFPLLVLNWVSWADIIQFGSSHAQIFKQQLFTMIRNSWFNYIFQFSISKMIRWSWFVAKFKHINRSRYALDASIFLHLFAEYFLNCIMRHKPIYLFFFTGQQFSPSSFACISASSCSLIFVLMAWMAASVVSVFTLCSSFSFSSFREGFMISSTFNTCSQRKVVAQRMPKQLSTEFIGREWHILFATKSRHHSFCSRLTHAYDWKTLLSHPRLDLSGKINKQKEK